ncbi:hypothetical protein HanRHA438_Chr17g0796251 [Helianthus annuus]|nr:hypothetical protein HanRHA438_Chr17g0796251 [Helianthus annuus]
MNDDFITAEALHEFMCIAGLQHYMLVESKTATRKLTFTDKKITDRSVCW